jgi:DNA-directed RNA polymerase specialized sigma24 family protein
LYRVALSRLKARDAELITLKLEDGRSYEDVASIVGFPSSNAARVATHRAILRLARELTYLTDTSARRRA